MGIVTCESRTSSKSWKSLGCTGVSATKFLRAGRSISFEVLRLVNACVMTNKVSHGGPSTCSRPSKRFLVSFKRLISKRLTSPRPFDSLPIATLANSRRVHPQRPRVCPKKVSSPLFPSQRKERHLACSYSWKYLAFSDSVSIAGLSNEFMKRKERSHSSCSAYRVMLQIQSTLQLLCIRGNTFGK